MMRVRKPTGKRKKTASKNVAQTSEAYLTIETVGGHEYDLTYFEPIHPFDVDRVTGVKIIAFNDENKILAVRKRKKFDPTRKLDIITGVHEGEDSNYEATIRREAKEEANVKLGHLHLAAVIERRFKGATSDTATYTIVMTARVIDFIPYGEFQEPNERFFFTKEEFLKKYNAGKPADLVKLIEMAEFVIEDDHGSESGYDPIIRRIMECC